MAFATADDVGQRLGRSLNDGEKGTATSVIATVTGLITDVVDRDAAWAAALDPVPEALKSVCVEKAIAAIANPSNLAAESEQLGAYQHSQTFQRSNDTNPFLTPFEERMVARAVYGANSGTSRPTSTVDELITLAEGEELK